MEEEVKEVKEVVLNRVPPGDKWVFTNSRPSTNVYESLTDALEAYYQLYGNTRFYIDARKGTVETVTDEVINKEVKKFSIYGED